MGVVESWGAAGRVLGVVVMEFGELLAQVKGLNRFQQAKVGAIMGALIADAAGKLHNTPTLSDHCVVCFHL